MSYDLKKTKKANNITKSIMIAATRRLGDC
jgi:hypothetical protein